MNNKKLYSVNRHGVWILQDRSDRRNIKQVASAYVGRGSDGYFSKRMPAKKWVSIERFLEVCKERGLKINNE